MTEHTLSTSKSLVSILTTEKKIKQRKEKRHVMDLAIFFLTGEVKTGNSEAKGYS